MVHIPKLLSVRFIEIHIFCEEKESNALLRNNDIAYVIQLSHPAERS